MSEPWPDVDECHGHRDVSEACAQCDGGHDHRWVAQGRKVRCRTCGGRKCDAPRCLSRRHHSDYHVLVSGELEPIGGIWAVDSKG